ncbi:50S ribosomal protein L35 [Patescibacteria group bacterium]
MPKIKTHQGMKKRVKITAGGKLKRRHANRSHNRVNKKPETKQDFRKSLDVKKSDQKNVKRLVPYL